MSRGWPEIMSSPTVDSTRPRLIIITVFSGSSPPSPTKVVKARSTSANSSAGPNASATSASGLARMVNRMTAEVPPTKDAMAAAMMARPALPCWAMGRPSKVVATAALSPGMPRRIELIAPPYIDP